MPELYNDIAVEYDFVFRAGNDGIIRGVFLNTIGSDFDFTGYTIEYLIYRNLGGTVWKTIVPTIVGNQVTVELSEIDLARAGTYFYEWRFTVGGITRAWFAGKHKVIVGKPINTSGNVLTVTVNTTVPSLIVTVAQYTAISYLIYCAIVSQTGTSAPTGTPLTNQIGTLTWSYVSVGKYKLSKTGGFDTTKTLLSVPLGVVHSLYPNYVKVSFDTDNNLLFETWNSALEYADNILSNFNFDIRTF